MEFLLDTEILLSLAIALFAGIVRGFSGFGSGMIMAAALSAIYGPVLAIPIVVALETGVSLQLAPLVRRQIDWRALVYLVPPALLSVPLGAWVLLALDAEIMRLFISIAILIAVLLLSLGLKRRGEPHPLGSLATGLVSGLLAGAAAMPGPPVILYFLSGGESARRVRASLIGFFLFADAWALVIFAWQGQIGTASLWRIAGLLPIFILGSWIGSRLFGRADERFYRRIALALVAAIAVGSLLV